MNVPLSMKNKKINITVDGKPYEAREGQTLLEFAKSNDIFLPSLCFYEHIFPPLGTCRVCTVNVNGTAVAGCMANLKDGMNIEINTPELADIRKAMVEMLFAEGNHFCPSCEKSGDCDLQGLGYQLGVRVSRFPHLFVDRIIDYAPQRMLIEQNRCILCRRCMEEVKTKDGHKVFSFLNRGNETHVAIDYEQEAKLSDEEAKRAMNICPTGAILVSGRSGTRPIGERKYDMDTSSPVEADEIKIKAVRHEGKLVVATTSMAGCFGCHMSLLDIDEELLDVLELVEFNRTPLTDIKKFTKRCDIGLLEGGCCNSENIEVLKSFRENCDILIAVGECSIWGGLPAMRNPIPLQECLEESFFHSPTTDQTTIIPEHEDIPKILDRVYACNEVVHIDYYIPGCPPNAQHIWKVIKNIALGTGYSVLREEYKYD